MFNKLFSFFNGGEEGKERVFLDYASITPVGPEVLRVMRDNEGLFANPSALYEEGRLAKEILLDARTRIASFFGLQKKEIIFTSGGTESNNLALLGVFENAKRLGITTPHIITTNIEHPSIIEVCHEILRRGGDVTFVPVGEDGVVSAKDITKSIKENTVLVSIMYANNEIGTIQPIRDIARGIKKYKEENKNQNNFPLLHTDASQAVLYEEMNMLKLGVDILTCDGIKMYGPRGIGVLCLRSGVEIRQLFFGGGQERGLRSGTENASAILGLATAFDLAEKYKIKEKERLCLLRDYAISEILKNFPDSELNGSKENRLPNNINICFPDTDSEFLVVALDVEGVAVSYSSSCRTLAEDSSSYVVEALAGDKKDKKRCSTSSLRITLGRQSIKSDIDTFVKALRKVIHLV